MTNQPDEKATLAVVVARLDDLRNSVSTEFENLRNDLKHYRNEKVDQAVWEQRNAHVDSRLDRHSQELIDLRNENAETRRTAENKKATPAMIVAMVTGPLAIISSLLMWLVNRTG